MRKGRCSNDPQNCTLAASQTELPYAGVDSICPQCNAPLAALASSASSAASSHAPIPPPPPPPLPVAPAAAYQPAPQSPSPDSYDREPRFRPDDNYRASQSYEPETRAPRDGAMKLTQMVLAGAALALLGFFGWKMFLQPREAQAPDISSAQSNGANSGQVMQISPPQMRKVNVAAEARTIPDASSAIVANLAAGALLDVTGQVQVNGVNWLRVTLPNESSKSGFVREDQMVALGDGGLNVAPFDPLAPGMPTNGVAVPSVPVAPPAQGPIQPLTPVKYYVAMRVANVRADANPNSARVSGLAFNDEVDVVAQRTVGGKLWYQVQLPMGGTGWMNARLLSGDPRETPMDAPPPVAKTDKMAGPPPPPSDTPTSEVGKRDNQEALSAYGAGTTLRVDATTANLRKEPGATGNSVVEALGRDTLISVEDVRILNGVPWYRVTSPNGVQGWVSGRTVVENR